MQQIIGIIGAGNMGKSLLGGLIRHGHLPQNLWSSDVNEAQLKTMQESFGIHTTSDNRELAQKADVIIFAIKPQVFAQTVQNLAAHVQVQDKLFISIAAGIQTKSIATWLNAPAAIIRAMPNTPALIGAGASALFANPAVTPLQRKLAESILGAIGLIVWLDNEALMDVVTALSGSGPAYFFVMMESLKNAAVKLGLDNNIAEQLTIQTALGAARMAQESGLALTTLIKNVTSPGGTTEKALQILEAEDVQQIFHKAVEAATLRSKELATHLGDEKS